MILDSNLLLPLLDGEFVLAENFCREELLVGEVSGGVLAIRAALIVAVLSLHLVRSHQHRLLCRTVDVLGQYVAANLGIGEYFAGIDLYTFDTSKANRLV